MMTSNANSVPSEAHANLSSVSDAHMDVIHDCSYAGIEILQLVAMYSRKAPQDVPHTKSRDDCKKHVDVNVVAFVSRLIRRSPHHFHSG